MTMMMMMTLIVLMVLMVVVMDHRKVLNEFGNHLKLTCYEDDHGGKARIGEGSTKVMETGHAGAWVPITDDRKVHSSRW